jgi:hypothetical protein
MKRGAVKLAAAKGRIANALEDLGKGKDGPSLSQSCVWNTVGLVANRKPPNAR